MFLGMQGSMSRNKLFAWLLVGVGRLYLCRFVLDFLEAFDNVLNAGLVCIVLDGDGLVVKIGLDAFDALFEADVVLNLLLTVSTVHLRASGQYDCLDVLGIAGCSQC